MKTRNLKIEAAGDFCRGPVFPKIGLAGQWLERTGFIPGNRVEIIMNQSGILTLKFLREHDNNSIQTHSATLPVLGVLL